MRVVVNETMKVFHGHVPVQLAAGQEVGGELAAMLLERAPRKVTPLDAGGAGERSAPTALDIEATAPDVLGWVGDDPERAEEALEAELAKDRPRSTLVKFLEKLVGTDSDGA